jgi:hypothetical protein
MGSELVEFALLALIWAGVSLTRSAGTCFEMKSELGDRGEGTFSGILGVCDSGACVVGGFGSNAGRDSSRK